MPHRRLLVFGPVVQAAWNILPTIVGAGQRDSEARAGNLPRNRF